MKHKPPAFLGLSALLLIVSMSADAAPPFNHLTNRNLSGTGSATSCTNSATGNFCQGVSAYEARDIDGTYDFTGVNVYEQGQDYSNGYVDFYRSISCTVPRGSFTTSRSGAILEAILDSASVDCNSGGYRCDYSGEEPVCEPYAFPAVVVVRGTWEQAIQTSTGQTIRKSANSATGEAANFTCQESGGAMMRTGGFEIDGQFTPFDGRADPYSADTFLYSEFSDQSCNNNRKF
jgi:hypothetical protein